MLFLMLINLGALPHKTLNGVHTRVYLTHVLLYQNISSVGIQQQELCSAFLYPSSFFYIMLLMTTINLAMYKYFHLQLYRNIVSEQISIKICLKHEFTSKLCVD